MFYVINIAFIVLGMFLLRQALKHSDLCYPLDNKLDILEIDSNASVAEYVELKKKVDHHSQLFCIYVAIGMLCIIIPCMFFYFHWLWNS